MFAAFALQVQSLAVWFESWFYSKHTLCLYLFLFVGVFVWVILQGQLVVGL